MGATLGWANDWDISSPRATVEHVVIIKNEVPDLLQWEILFASSGTTSGTQSYV